MKVLVSNSAFADLEDIKQFYAEQGIPDTGIKFLAAIFDHVETLKAHTRIGRVAPEFGDDAIREIIHPPFRVIYLLENKTVHIIRVWRRER